MPVTIALMMMVNWAVVIGSSSTTNSVRISAKITGITPFHMCIKWNSLYSGLVLLALDLYLIVML
jgi:hypothetical protein